MDSFVQCHYCKKHLINPLQLICRHSYCTECLTKEIQNDKIICPVCDTEHTAPAASLSSAKQDKLAPYLIGLNSGVPYSTITDDSPPTIQAECAGCKKITDLRICFHCEKPLCTGCRTKHHESQKKEVDQSVHNLISKTNELVGLAQTLNTSRTNRIQEYKTMKDQVTLHVKDLIKTMHDDEQDLQKRIDARIQYETERIDVTDRELQHLHKNKETLDEVVDKYRDENNQMVLIKMHKDYLDSASTWKEKLETCTTRINAKKEEQFNFQPSRPKKNDPLVGTLVDLKNVNIHASSSGTKSDADRNAQSKSRSCTVL